MFGFEELHALLLPGRALGRSWSAAEIAGGAVLEPQQSQASLDVRGAAGAPVERAAAVGGEEAFAVDRGRK